LEKGFQERRHKEFDIYSRELIYNYIQWNAWYFTPPKMLVIPPGFLDFPMKRLKLESCQYYAILGHPISHEFGHIIDDIVKTFDSQKYQQFSNEIKQRYKFPNQMIHEENLADNIGLLLSYYSFTKTPRTDDEKKCFFLSFIRLRCPSTLNKPPDITHASNFERVIFPLQIWADEFKRLFCE
jgi:hypothetical protein